MTESKLTGRDVVRSLLGIVVVFATFLFGCPAYHVWGQHMKGEAELARANANRRVKVAEALATREAAIALAQADSIRAEGEAKANAVIGHTLEGETGERRLRYLWIRGMEEGEHREVHYIPTEGGMPLIVGPRASMKAEVEP